MFFQSDTPETSGSNKPNVRGWVPGTAIPSQAFRLSLAGMPTRISRAARSAARTPQLIRVTPLLEVAAGSPPRVVAIRRTAL